MSDRVILHSDCNCFYASVEMLHHPELKGKPIAVVGDPEKRHGIILTANYVAKRMGVKTGIPLWQAKNLCPNIQFLPARMDLYLRFSKMAQNIYADYTDLWEPYGCDESWLDVTASVSLLGDGEQIAKEIRSRIKKELGITVSIGISWNKIFAKLGSDYKKPDAITTMYRDEYQEKAWKLPVSDLLYVGRKTNVKFKNIGIHTIGDLARMDIKLMEQLFGKMGVILWSFANGYDSSPVKKEHTRAVMKSIGNSTTCPRDLENKEEVLMILYVLTESVAARLRENGFRCRVVEISIRNSELCTITRQRKMQNATNITSELVKEAYQLFCDHYDFNKPVRSLSVRGTDLVTEYYHQQLDLFHNYVYRAKQEQMDLIVDNIRKRFGYDSIQRGLLLKDKSLSSLNVKEDHVIHPMSFFS